MRIPLQMLALAVLSTACASGAGTAGSGAPAPEAGARTARGPIAREELENRNAPNLLVAIQVLRPSWLRISNPRVYVGSAPAGDQETLKDINPVSVDRVEYLTPNQAIARYGRNHGGGVIIVVMRS